MWFRALMSKRKRTISRIFSLKIIYVLDQILEEKRMKRFK